ncbi:hypothetical protein DC3_37270 [Deinococcus cellulosilyticus NBRC 106333 = KACC 11606]|uniref:Uncharacterized protein n=2 Tax=Deinococcus cellulosilyticus TaxID=401558 RepID=A0A511N5F9_DEIC1|nr:hypothetical protein DC3_37270 [Deinococcus cellulosilyticus NBRC 106333 = KACC 11606]
MLSTASAINIPLEGWTSITPTVWVSTGSACLLRETQHTKPFEPLATRLDADAFGRKLKAALEEQKMKEVTTEATSRLNQWAVMATYTMNSEGRGYFVTQVYLSENGKLRTITGSSRITSDDTCTFKMREFLRYGAY